MSRLTVLFDASGTLVTPRRTFHELVLSSGIWREPDPGSSIQRALMSMGKDALWPDDEPDPDLRFKGWYSFLETTILRSGGAPDPTSCRAAAEAILDPANYTDFPDVLPCLDKLRNDDRVGAIGLVSNFDPWLREILDILGLTQYFDHLSISGETGYAKPDPQAIHHATSALNADPRQTVLVGDSIAVDGGAAEAAGIKLVLIDRTGSLYYSGAAILTSLDQIPTALDLN